MKWALRNKTAEKRLKMAIFKLLVLSYMHTILYISFFYSNNIIFVHTLLSGYKYFFGQFVPSFYVFVPRSFRT